jgi:hypothetical protein
MLDTLVVNYKIIIITIVFILALFKVIHFLNYKRRNWGWKKLFYFSQVEILGSDDEYTRKAKKLQNTLTSIIVLLFGILIIMLYLFRHLAYS